MSAPSSLSEGCWWGDLYRTPVIMVAVAVVLGPGNQLT